MTRASRWAAALLLAAGCAAPTPPPAPPHVDLPPPEPVAPAPAPAPPAAPDPGAEAARKVSQMLDRVAKIRGLPIRHTVASKVLDRRAILARIREHVEKEIPREAIEHEGELLAALGLVGPHYDFVAGTYKLIEGRIAGFYEPSDETMYLVDDLGDEEAQETLAHELDHALQDQSFAIGKMIAYAPGEGDRTSAVHALIEGDAMSAMFDVSIGSAFDVSESMLRMVLAASNAMSDVAAETPHVLQSSLTAPYGDGFAFVQRTRKAGGWPAVDAALRSPPLTTEQLLHADKYAVHEPAIPVPVPSITALGPGFRAVLDDVVGEQGLRLMLEEWVNDRVAEQAADGWGGDHYVIARRDDGPDRHTIAVGWKVVMDTDHDTTELANVLKNKLGARCIERPDVGPLLWKRQGRAVVFAAGPYERRTGGGSMSAATAGKCADAARWAAEMMKR